MLKIYFVKRAYNPISWLIRWAVPLSRLRVCPASHCIVEIDGIAYHSTMTHGVVREKLTSALKPYRVIKSVSFNFPNKQAAIDFAESQIGKPYDWAGAFGMFVNPMSRAWQKDDAWSCSEWVAAMLHAGGRNFFSNLGHVTPMMLLMLMGDE